MLVDFGRNVSVIEIDVGVSAVVHGYVVLEVLEMMILQPATEIRIIIKAVTDGLGILRTHCNRR